MIITIMFISLIFTLIISALVSAIETTITGADFVKIETLSDKGDKRASKVLKLQDKQQAHHNRSLWPLLSHWHLPSCFGDIHPLHLNIQDANKTYKTADNPVIEGKSVVYNIYVFEKNDLLNTLPKDNIQEAIYHLSFDKYIN